MSDRRAVSAGHLGASSVAAANETWRVAVGGNRVESMTVDQIAQAFHNGQLNVRTPLWPPGTTGWQALGNFDQFQHYNPGYANANYANAGYDAGSNAAYNGGLSQFEEADDDPTRMWTGSNDDLQNLGGQGLEGMQPPPAAQQRPSARTGIRQVSRPAPSQGFAAPPPPPPPVASRPVAVPAQPSAVPTRSMPPTPSLASRTPALVPASGSASRRSRGNGLMLVAGLVGLVGLGSAVLAARGSWGSASEPPANVAVSAETPEPAAPEVSAAAPAAEAPAAEEPKTEPSKAEGGEAQLAKYEDTSAPASAFVAGEPGKKAERAEPAADAPGARSKREKADDAAERSAKPEKAAKSARNRAEEPAPKKLIAKTAPRRAAAPLPRQTPPPAPPPRAEKVVERVEKTEKAETPEVQQPPANSAVNEAAAAALANSANLASSCRPRGGPAGPGKARVIYSNDGEVQSVEILTAKFRDTLTGSCVRMVFRRAKIPPFKGEPPTFIKSFSIPEE
jgi:hypothetical protein